MKVKELLKKLKDIPDNLTLRSGLDCGGKMCNLRFSNRDLDYHKTFFQVAQDGDISSRECIAIIISRVDIDTTVKSLKEVLMRSNPDTDVVVGSHESNCYCSEFYFYPLGGELRIL